MIVATIPPSPGAFAQGAGTATPWAEPSAGQRSPDGGDPLVHERDRLVQCVPGVFGGLDRAADTDPHLRSAEDRRGRGTEALVHGAGAEHAGVVVGDRDDG